MNKFNIVTGGASITSGPWPTWVDIIKEKYKANVFDVSKKGLGNEAIITTALHQASQIKSRDIIVIVMLTNIDKWDWYVDRPDLLDKFAEEKHTITKLDNTQDGGFWGTGSWFPLEKQVYRDNFYSEDYFVMRTLQMIAVFQQVCQARGWKGHIMFDSPIWSMTEQEVNLGGPIDAKSCKLVNTPLNKWLYESLDYVTYEPGLIGFLDDRGIPWFSPKYRAHPGPRAHFEFSKVYIFPFLDLHVEDIGDDIVHLEAFIDKMNQLWTA